ncbi:hypothetical protein ACFXPS_41200 [Nocardia sp. NPDC059091]|uniref:hypothetical protein n=1 Tax=unclassified Nocardia TaxID=2637762 RepID=UPI0036ABB9F4
MSMTPLVTIAILTPVVAVAAAYATVAATYWWESRRRATPLSAPNSVNYIRIEDVPARLRIHWPDARMLRHDMVSPSDRTAHFRGYQLVESLTTVTRCGTKGRNTCSSGHGLEFPPNLSADGAMLGSLSP